MKGTGDIETAGIRWGSDARGGDRWLVGWDALRVKV